MYLAGLAREDRREGRVRPHRRAQERARAVHERARERRRAGRSGGHASPARGGLRAQHGALPRTSPRTSFREISAKGPFVASEARDAKLVDGYAFDDELERVTHDVVGTQGQLREATSDETTRPTYFGHAPAHRAPLHRRRHRRRSIADVPLLDIEARRLVHDRRVGQAAARRRRRQGAWSSASRARRLVDGVRRHVARAEEARREEAAHRLDGHRSRRAAATTSPRRRKPIFALPLTVTGSIGIFYGKADVSELLGKIGVNVEVRKTTPRADAESFYRGFTDDERVELETQGPPVLRRLPRSRRRRDAT